MTELRGGRGTFAVIDCSLPFANGTVAAINTVVSETIEVGRQLTAGEAPATAASVLERASGPTLLLDVEVLLTPAVGIDLVSQLRTTARRVPLVVAWPGRLENGRLSFSAPGRQDHLDVPLRDVLVLRPVHTEFPDEVPYLVERFHA